MKKQHENLVFTQIFFVFFAFFVLFFPSKVLAAALYNSTSEAINGTAVSGTILLGNTDFGYNDVDGTYTLGSMRGSFFRTSGVSGSTSVYFYLQNDAGGSPTNCVSQTTTPDALGATVYPTSGTGVESPILLTFTGSDCTFIDSGADSWQIHSSVNNFAFYDAGTESVAWGVAYDETGEVEQGVFPTFPDGQTNLSYLTLFSGYYGFLSSETPNKLVFHITNETDTESFDVVKTIITDIDDVWGTSGGLTCENCPDSLSQQRYQYQIALEASKEYTYTVELLRNDISYYESDEFTFETGDYGDIDDPSNFINGGLTCDNCSDPLDVPRVVQNFFPFNVIWQMKAAMKNGLDDTSEESIASVDVPFMDGSITVFAMDGVEDLMNGDEESTAATDFIRDILSASLYLAFGYMVYRSASGVIQSMTA